MDDPVVIERTYEIVFRVTVESEQNEYEPVVVDRAINAWKHDLLGDKNESWFEHVYEVREVYGF